MTAPDSPAGAGPVAAAEAAWLAYRDEYHRSRVWADQRRLGRQLRKRDFIAGYLAAANLLADPAATDAAAARAWDECLAAVTSGVRSAKEAHAKYGHRAIVSALVGLESAIPRTENPYRAVRDTAEPATVLDLEDPYYDGQTLPDALADYDHVHSTTGICVKNVHGPLCGGDQ